MYIFRYTYRDIDGDVVRSRQILAEDMHDVFKTLEAKLPAEQSYVEITREGEV